MKINQDIRMYENKIKQKEAEIERVENLLDGLDNVERFVLEQFYMYQRQRWDYVIDEFLEKYRDQRSKEQLKRIKKNAINKILSVLNA